MLRRTAEQRRRWSQNANAAKARYRMQRDRVEPEPRMSPWCRFSITVTDKLTGDSHTLDLRSVRDVSKRLSLVLRYLQ
jgi:hypothetical protein